MKSNSAFPIIPPDKPKTWRLFSIGLSILSLMLQAGCRQSEPMDDLDDAPSSPAAISGSVHLPADAQELIGLSVEPVRRQPLTETVRTSGWIRSKPGQHALVKAPATGFYMSGSERSQPEIGSHVSVGQSLGTLKVLLSPQAEAQLVAAKEEVDILMNQSLVTLRLAEEQLDRLRESSQQVVPGTRLMELQETIERARVAYKEAQEKLPYLPKEPYGPKLDLKSMPIESPMSGRVTHIDVAPRQLVVQGDPLWTVADWSTLWLEVPVFFGDVPRVQQEQESRFEVPGLDRTFTARPIPAAQPTEPGRRTVDLLYEIDNSAGTLRPGQPVSVALPVGPQRERLIIPRTAVIWDGMGNAWVYIRSSTTTFHRQRVELGQGDAHMVSVTRGLEDGQQVVTVGAESLYGEEFKGQIQVEDDD